MDITIVNETIKRIHFERDHASFETLLVVMDGLLDRIAYAYYEKFEDKMLYSKEDIMQEIAIELWLCLIDREISFKEEKDAIKLLIKLAERALERTRS